MFTGLVESVGQVARLSRAAGASLIVLDAAGLSGGLGPGDSLAVDGVCLTVTAVSGPRVSVTALTPTRDRTTIGLWRVGRRVNLERAVAAGDRLGGHLVSGHVDGRGRVLRMNPGGGGHRLAVLAPAECLGLLVGRGSVAVDGVSLTVASARGPVFECNLVPETMHRTTLGRLRPGSLVNVEVDMMARYASNVRS